MNHPQIRVIPEDYPLKNPRKLLLKIEIGVGILLVSLILCSNMIEPYTKNYIPKEFFDWVNENKIAKILFIFFLGKMIANVITSTGAFEIFCKGKLIWSTIEHNGRLPDMPELKNIMKQVIEQIK